MDISKVKDGDTVCEKQWLGRHDCRLASCGSCEEALPHRCHAILGCPRILDDGRVILAWKNKQNPREVIAADVTKEFNPSTTNTKSQPSDQSSMESSSENTPDGKSPSDPGAKLDAGKAPVVQGLFHYFPRACRAVAMLSFKGAEKYAWKGWEDVDDGVTRYANAAGRHILDESEKGMYDNQDGGTGELHMTCVAWNDLAALELRLRELEEQGIPPRVW